MRDELLDALVPGRFVPNLPGSTASGGTGCDATRPLADRLRRFRDTNEIQKLIIGDAVLQE